ncbi:MAG: hypothetical protein HY272_03165 [Gammaproteobacteria bacterium]|nr:hypothetical protein [Gammaproteobacteria bacterium]
MLRWSTSELRVALSPDRITFCRRRSLRQRAVTPETIVCSSLSTDQRPWAGAIAALVELLADARQRQTCLHVILSNHFVRYLALSLPVELTQRDEIDAYVRHQFSVVYGNTSSALDIRWTRSGNQQQVIVCGIRSELIREINALATNNNLRLVSIEPLLIAAFNHWRNHLKADCWFATYENQRLCLAAISKGNIQALRTVAIDSERLTNLGAIFERSRLGLDGAPSTNDIFLHDADGLPSSSITNNQWQIKTLAPASINHSDSHRLAMAGNMMLCLL